MYFHNVVGTGSDTKSTTNMYHKDRTYRVLQSGPPQSGKHFTPSCPSSNSTPCTTYRVEQSSPVQLVWQLQLPSTPHVPWPVHSLGQLFTAQLSPIHPVPENQKIRKSAVIPNLKDIIEQLQSKKP